MGLFDAINSQVDNKIVNAATLFCRLVRAELDRSGTTKVVREQLLTIFDNALIRYIEASADTPTVQRVIPRIRVEVRRCLMD